MPTRTLLMVVLTLATLGSTRALHADLSAPQPFNHEAPFYENSSIRGLPAQLAFAPKDTAPRARPTGTPTPAAVQTDRLFLAFPQDDWATFPALYDPVADAPGSTQVIELPPSPSSAALFLSAMLSAGAWHLARSARHLHLSHLPDWYHTGAPAHIGHAVPFDFNFTAQPLCCFEQPLGERPFLSRVERQPAPRSAAQCFLLITAPRGPPARLPETV